MKTRDRIKQVVTEAIREAQANGNGRVNATGRKNVRIASNIGRPGSETRAVSVQTAPVRQDDRTS